MVRLLEHARQCRPMKTVTVVASLGLVVASDCNIRICIQISERPGVCRKLVSSPTSLPDESQTAGNSDQTPCDHGVDQHVTLCHHAVAVEQCRKLPEHFGLDGAIDPGKSRVSKKTQVQVKLCGT